MTNAVHLRIAYVYCIENKQLVTKKIKRKNLHKPLTIINLLCRCLSYFDHCYKKYFTYINIAHKSCFNINSDRTSNLYRNTTQFIQSWIRSVYFKIHITQMIFHYNIVLFFNCILKYYAAHSSCIVYEYIVMKMKEQKLNKRIQHREFYSLAFSFFYIKMGAVLLIFSSLYFFFVFLILYIAIRNVCLSHKFSHIKGS